MGYGVAAALARTTHDTYDGVGAAASTRGFSQRIRFIEIAHPNPTPPYGMLEAGPVQDLEGAIAQLQKKKRRKQNPSL
jgi:hypothetical protein